MAGQGSLGRKLLIAKGSGAKIARLLVSRIVCGSPHRGRLRCGTLTLPCAIGRAGVTGAKREGDGATPRGSFRLLFALFRPERFSRSQFSPPARILRRSDIWCDDADSFLYNRPLRGSSRLSHEELWRKDGLYDFIGVLDYNISPRVRGRGSAIFFHIATEELGATAGCVALRRRDMARLLPRLAKKVRVEVR
ncbi:L,D-transpeptidase family protein [Methylocystis heyeri]|uniref:L,D-transpeptidase family protein n=2 Tax=Methylocystis heyeri TaxID=391905 RepID=A0A6B8KI28_9HYPH|nr:L,D-transpeptidase family protein [Methylocystis heyeri]